MHVSARLTPLALLLVLLQPASAPAAEEPSAARSEYQQAVSKLNWVRGPAKADLFGKASIQVPEGYVFLNPADTAKFMTLNQNLSGEREYLLAQINRFGGNISRTAAFIGMERSALHRKLKSLGVGSAQNFNA